MKTVVLLVLVGFIANSVATAIQLSEDQQVKAKAYFDECAKQENVTEEDATRLRNRDFVNPSQNMKCFGTCFFEKVGTLKNDQVQEEVVVKILSPLIGLDMTHEILKTCKSIKDGDRCDNGFKIYECFENYKSKLTK